MGHVGKLPESVVALTIKYHDLNRDDVAKRAIVANEALLLGIGTATAIGYVKKIKRDTVSLELKHASCIEKKAKISVMRNMAQRWRLTGYGIVE